MVQYQTDPNDKNFSWHTVEKTKKKKVLFIGKKQSKELKTINLLQSWQKFLSLGLVLTLMRRRLVTMLNLNFLFHPMLNALSSKPNIALTPPSKLSSLESHSKNL